MITKTDEKQLLLVQAFKLGEYKIQLIDGVLRKILLLCVFYFNTTFVADFLIDKKKYINK